jgi:hypothetical protein
VSRLLSLEAASPQWRKVADELDLPLITPKRMGAEKDMFSKRGSFMTVADA